MSWLQAFPWLSRAGLPLKKSVQYVNSQNAEIDNLATIPPEMLNYVLRELSEFRLEEICPWIPDTSELSSFDLGELINNNSGLTALHSFSEIGNKSLKELVDFGLIGQNDQQNFLSIFMIVNLIFAEKESRKTRDELASIAEINSDKSDLHIGDGGLDVHSRLSAAMQVLALYLIENDYSDLPILKLAFEVGSDVSHSVSEAVAFVTRLDAKTVLGLNENEINSENEKEVEGSTTRVPSYALLESFINELTNREIQILIGRVLKDKPDSLELIGEEFGITRERVRQLESKLLTNLRDWFSTDALILGFSKDFNARIGNLILLEDLLRDFPELTKEVSSLGLPTWYVFDKFDDSFESDGKWVASPSMSQVAQSFDSLFDQSKSSENFLDFDEFQRLITSWTDTEVENIVEWCLSRGYLICDKIIIGPANHTLLSVSHALLASRTLPISTDELWNLIPLARSMRSLANQLGDDERFARVGPNLWALKKNTESEYKSIRDELEKSIKDNGPTHIQILEDELESKFGVSKASVRTYANNWPFQIVNDIVDFAETNTSSGRDFSRTKRSYYLSDSKFAIRSVVSTDHLRGSGFAIPSGLAAKLGVQPGTERIFKHHETGSELSLRWPGLQPQMSSIRKPMNMLGAEVGDQFKLIFDGPNISISIISENLDDNDEKLKFIFSIDSINELTLFEIARQLQTDQPSEMNIATLLTARGEEDCLKLLCQKGLIRPSLSPEESS